MSLQTQQSVICNAENIKAKKLFVWWVWRRTRSVCERDIVQEWHAAVSQRVLQMKKRLF